ncbi:MAG: response regulator [Opitutales bacterium]|jgi:DNA-binding response OmpR family regulator
MSKPIILIDDEKKFALMLHELLQGSGYEADYCLNPEEALVRLKQENYQLVITDYKMPQMDGGQFLQEARVINPDLPVIMISGLMNMPELIKVANIGVTLVLEKPFNIEELLENVARFVKPSASGQASAEAMDMEASEISFQQEKVSVTYPSPASCLADASNENKRFLETLWKSANGCRHLPFYAQHGAEVRLVAMELMNWTGQEVQSDVVRIEFAETSKEITRDWVAACDPFPGALLVDLRGVQWDDKARAKLADWVKFLEKCGKDLSMSRIIYVLPMGIRFDLGEVGLPAELEALFSTEWPVLLSLRERLLDTATYISRLLGEKEKKALGRKGLAQLLHHSWSGGYMELQDKLCKITRLVEEEGELDEGQVHGVLHADVISEVPAGGEPNVVAYLKRRQREYILLHRQQGEDLKDTVLRLGIDSDTVTVDDVLEDKSLAFPGVLEE